MEKQTIKNRKDQNVVVVFDEVPDSRGLAFVMHGLSGNKEQTHIQTFAKAFHNNGYTTVLFDTTNTFGESDGNFEDATVTNYYEDLEDVISWSKQQSWYKEPFCLVGHSLGGISTAHYSEIHPDEVKALAPISTVVSGKLSMESGKMKKIAKEWKETGWRVMQSKSRNITKRLKWSHMEDRLRYDLLPEANKLTMPVLMIVGDEDDSTPAKHQQLLLDAIPGAKEIHIIKGAPHSFKEQSHLDEIYSIFDKWIKSFETQR